MCFFIFLLIIQVAAGLSLGEYSALCIAGSFPFETGVKLTKVRGKAMQYASDAQKSQMIAVAGAPIQKVLTMIDDINTAAGETSLWLANYLAPDVFTLAGSCVACESVKKGFKQFGLKSATILPVSGAFHTKYMYPAVDMLRAAINDANIKIPNFPVMSNVTGERHNSTSVSELQQSLLDQLVTPVQWDRCIDNIIESSISFSGQSNDTVIYEIGPGSVCSNLLKRKNIRTLNIRSVLT